MQLKYRVYKSEETQTLIQNYSGTKQDKDFTLMQELNKIKDQ